MSNATIHPLINTTTLFSTYYGDTFGCAFLAICMLGIIGNMMVVVAFCRKVIPITPFSILLLNLSLADIYWDIGVLPALFIDLKDYVHSSEAMKKLVCGIVQNISIAFTGLNINLLTIAYISCIRSSSLNLKMKRSLLTKKNVAIYLICGWTISFVVPLPWYFLFTLNENTGVCETKYNTIYKIYMFKVSILLWFLCLCVLLFNFIKSVKFMWRKSLFSQSFIVRERRQITTLLLTLICIYITLFTPQLVVYILTGVGYFSHKESVHYNRTVGILSLLTTVLDPIVYAVCNRGFRKGIKDSSKRIKNDIQLRPVTSKSNVIA